MEPESRLSPSLLQNNTKEGIIEEVYPHRVEQQQRIAQEFKKERKRRLENAEGFLRTPELYGRGRHHAAVIFERGKKFTRFQGDEKQRGLYLIRPSVREKWHVLPMDRVFNESELAQKQDAMELNAHAYNYGIDEKYRELKKQK